MSTLGLDFKYSDFLTKVKKQLSLIGKRTFSNDGKSLYSKITVSSLEAPLLEGYIKSGMEKIASNFRDNMCNIEFEKSQETPDLFRIEITNDRWENVDGYEPNSDALEEEIVGFLISYTLAEYLSPNYGELAEKFIVDYKDHLMSMSKLIYYKTPPKKSTASYSDIKGTINT